ncbi:MAG: hypothetical protein U0984_08305 [Prosthecobacter sp.]|nr:hypothetical protein [Prosthecobacter sp.]
MTILATTVRGSIGFAVVSTAAFATWAFGDAWFYEHGGELVMYAACCLVFIVLAGLVLRPLLRWPGTIGRFYGFFVPAFLAYAIAWCAGWLLLRSATGEWLGSLAGSAAFSIVMAATVRGWRVLLPSILVMFLAHSAGYFVGAYICAISLHSVGSMLAWGCLYGLGFGAGIGYAFALMHRSWKPEPS